MFECLDLNDLYNNKGISEINNIGKANFTGFGSSYPKEDLIRNLNDTNLKIPININVTSEYDNFELFNQIIEVPNSRYNKIHFIGASENGSFEENVILKGKTDDMMIKLGLTDWFGNEPEFGEYLVAKCDGVNNINKGYIKGFNPKLWLKTIDISEVDNQILSIHFPDNPSMHIFSIIMERS